MADQAALLREKMARLKRRARSAAVVSGKGGVGKSSFSMNFALALAAKNQTVLVIDMDIGMGNIHILLGKPADYSLKQYLNGETELQNLVIEGPEGIRYISGGSGLDSLMTWSDESFQRLLQAFEAFQSEYDVILFDMGAGATEETLNLLLSIDDIIVVTTPEPTAITDAYSMMKYISLKDPEKRMSIVCNRAERQEEGLETIRRLQETMKRFMDKAVYAFGVILEEPAVRQAVRLQKPFSLAFPKAKATLAVETIAEAYLKEAEWTSPQSVPFTDRLKSLFRKGRATQL